jgi:hypothetical protein
MAAADDDRCPSTQKAEALALPEVVTILESQSDALNDIL